MTLIEYVVFGITPELGCRRPSIPGHYVAGKMTNPVELPAQNE